MKLNQILKGEQSKPDPRIRMNQTFGHVVENECQSCAHRTAPLTCTAFPAGIPIVILMGAYDHTHPYDFDGMDDHGITYEPKE